MLPLELLLIAGLAWSSAAAQPTAYGFLELSSLDDSQARLAEGMPRPNARRYRCFGGHVEQYPDLQDWLSWDALWNINREMVLSINGGDTYIQHFVMESILQVARESDVDPRLILAVVMQETNARVSTGCDGSVPRCGILHASKGHTFDSSRPQDSITEMIREGVQGSSKSGPGLAKLLSGKPAVANVPPGSAFAAARAYNSGVVGANLDEVSHGQPGYVNDIANRLLGWDGRGKEFNSC